MCKHLREAIGLGLAKVGISLIMENAMLLYLQVLLWLNLVIKGGIMRDDSYNIF